MQGQCATIIAHMTRHACHRLATRVTAAYFGVRDRAGGDLRTGREEDDLFHKTLWNCRLRELSLITVITYGSASPTVTEQTIVMYVKIDSDGSNCENLIPILIWHSPRRTTRR